MCICVYVYVCVCMCVYAVRYDTVHDTIRYNMVCDTIRYDTMINGGDVNECVYVCCMCMWYDIDDTVRHGSI